MERRADDAGLLRPRIRDVRVDRSVAAQILEAVSGPVPSSGDPCRWPGSTASSRSTATPPTRCWPRAGGPVILAYCWSHVRRRFYEIAQGGNAPIAEAALQRINVLYNVEQMIRGHSRLSRGPLRAVATLGGLGSRAVELPDPLHARRRLVHAVDLSRGRRQHQHRDQAPGGRWHGLRRLP
jgi:hypothetical protein